MGRKKKISEDIMNKILNLYGKGFSLRNIENILKKSGIEIDKNTIHRAIQGHLAPSKAEKALEIYKLLPEELKSKLKQILLFKTQEKGKTRTLSLSQIYELLKFDMLKHNLNITKSQFYEFVEYFIIREFGSHEKLEKQRRLKKELAQFVVSKGTVKRETGLWEIDATGYSYNGKNYSIMQVIDTFSMYAFPPLVIENKEKNANHYNKAFNSRDVAYYLMKLCLDYGIPEEIKSDNERIIKNEYLQKAFEMLGIKYRTTKAYNPGSKVIERTFREIKDTIRLLRASQTDLEFQELYEKAIEYYNKKEHDFKHLQGSLSPAEIISAFGLGTRQIDEDKIRLAFSERYERKVINNTIKIDNLVYEFILPQYEHELGRDKESKTVICYRDLENITNLFVYSQNNEEYLGIAKLISQPANLETITHKQEIQKQKRIEKRIKKLEQEKTILEVEKQQQSQDIPIINTNLNNFFNFEEEQQKQEKEAKEELNILEILIKEEEKW